MDLTTPVSPIILCILVSLGFQRHTGLTAAVICTLLFRTRMAMSLFLKVELYSSWTYIFCTWNKDKNIHFSIIIMMMNVTLTLFCTSICISFIHSIILLARSECDDSLHFSGASSIPLCYIPSPSTLFHQLVFLPLSLHLANYFLVYLSALLLSNSYIILFWEFYFLPFSVHAQINVI